MAMERGWKMKSSSWTAGTAVDTDAVSGRKLLRPEGTAILIEAALTLPERGFDAPAGGRKHGQTVTAAQA